ncbi:hypothetical protein LPJ59_006406, partial [Coemansia sp. RSA 2399]
VFIHEGKLHIVPLATADRDGVGSGTEIIGVNAALDAVVGDAVATLASSAADEAAFERLKE